MFISKGLVEVEGMLRKELVAQLVRELPSGMCRAERLRIKAGPVD